MPGLVPQTPNARVNFGEILKAIRAQLVADEVVAGPSVITWGTPQQIPQLSGPSDLLLVARNAEHDPRDGGPAEFQLKRLVDLWWRTQAIADPGGGWEDYIATTFTSGDTIIASVALDGYWPEDADGNLLTIQAIHMVGDAAPDYPPPGGVYGSYVCTIAVIYFPLINPGRGIFPMP